MAHAPTTIAAIRALYVSGKPLEAAARELGVGDGTARRWRQDALRRGDDWKSARTGAALPPVGLPAVLAAVERLDAKLGELADAGGVFMPAGWTVSGEGEVLSEADRVASAVARLRCEVRCGFAAVLLVAALVGIWTVAAG